MMAPNAFGQGYLVFGLPSVSDLYFGGMHQYSLGNKLVCILQMR